MILETVGSFTHSTLVSLGYTRRLSRDWLRERPFDAVPFKHFVGCSRGRKTHASCVQ